MLILFWLCFKVFFGSPEIDEDSGIMSLKCKLLDYLCIELLFKNNIFLIIAVNLITLAAMQWTVKQSRELVLDAESHRQLKLISASES